MKSRPSYCWDCGVRVIDARPLENCRLVRFARANGSVTDSPFCTECAERPWDAARIEAFNAASLAACPDFPPVATFEAVLLAPANGVVVL